MKKQRIEAARMVKLYFSVNSIDSRRMLTSPGRGGRRPCTLRSRPVRACPGVILRDLVMLGVPEVEFKCSGPNETGHGCI
eukprot:COSAG02_NODE_905_length_16042_cov_60.273600_7_plen_80_part_00